jgi:hypothetical protein
MVTLISANFRQAYKWVGNLDAPSALSLGVGVFVGLSAFTGTAGAWEKALEIAPSVGLGTFFGLARLPLTASGERPLAWLWRVAAWGRGPRRAGMVAG